MFGDAFVCEDSSTAKKLAFDPMVNMLCVTVDGDVYSPAGTLSGGSDSTEKMSVLKRSKELGKLEEELRYTDHKLHEF